MTLQAITIIAGGWSASKVDLAHLPGTIIAVNDAAQYAPKWDICVSMDRLWAENRWKLIERATNKQFYLRGSTMKNVDPADMPHVHLFANDHTSTTLAENEGTLNGTHSGFCAINLAYHLRPRQLFLVGFDMQNGPRGEHHWYPDYPWKNGGGTSDGKLHEWSRQFERAAAQLDLIGCEVRAVGHPLANFKWITPAQLRDEKEYAF